MREKIILKRPSIGGYLWIYKDELEAKIDAINADKKNILGWKKYHELLKEKGYPIE